MSDNVVSRNELVSTISADTGISTAKVEAVIRSMEGVVARTLSTGGEVRLTGFGSFRVLHRAPRISRSVKTGELAEVPAHDVPRFTPGKGLKDAVSVHAAHAVAHGAVAHGAEAQGAEAQVATGPLPTAPVSGEALAPSEAANAQTPGTSRAHKEKKSKKKK